MYDTDTVKLGTFIASGKEYRLYLSEITSYGKCISTKLLTSDTEKLLKHHRKGGQSAPRFARIRENNYDRYVGELCDELVNTYMTENHSVCIIDKLIIAGPAKLKNEVLCDETVQKYLGKKIANVITTDVIDNKTIYELLESIDLKATIAEDKTKDINELILYKYELLLFGKEDIFGKEHRDEIRKIYVHSDFIDEYKDKIDEIKTTHSSIEIIKTNSKELIKFGGIIAEKWFVSKY